MPPAARVTDLHTCPLSDGPKPHVGGPILPPCSLDVIIGGLPAARVGDKALCAGPPDVIVTGCPTVLINGMLAARVTDMTAHGGVITTGCPTVLICDSSPGPGGMGGPGGACVASASSAGAPFVSGASG